MVKKRKIYEKILAGSKNIRFDEFILIVEAFGFILHRTRGSHQNYKHPEVPELLTLQPDKKGQMKPYQLRQFLNIVEEYQLKAKFEEDEQ